MGLLLGAAATLAGCAPMAYYGQAVQGHLALLQAARPIDAWLSDAATPEALKQSLRQAAAARRFAVEALALPDGPSYTRYADLKREAVSWNVVAAPAHALTLKTWCVPLAGCVGYRGYFDRRAADTLAAELKQAGWDVAVQPVPAYSTLGWTNWLGGDPLLNTFVSRQPADAARLIFHELAHQRVYVPSDTAFNEAYATAVEQLGLARWWQAHPDAAAQAADARREQRRAQWRALNAQVRAELQALYSAGGSRDALDAGKARALAAHRERARALAQSQGDDPAAAEAWAARANNATLAIQAAYLEQVPAFVALHESVGGDFAAFHRAVAQWAALPEAERRRAIAARMPGTAAR